MYAVVKTGGKEYRVTQGDLIRVEKLEGKVGDQVELKDVLMVSKEGEAQFGTPQLANVVIKGEIVQEGKGEKVLTYKMKRRKNYRRFKGHRQTYTYLKVNFRRREAWHTRKQEEALATAGTAPASEWASSDSAGSRFWQETFWSARKGPEFILART